MKVPIVLSVGRLVEGKGHIHLIRALKLLRREIELTIVGTGPERERLIAEAGTTVDGSKPTFRFTVVENPTQEKLHALYDQASVFVLPSIGDRRGWKEALGMVLLEAIAHRRPVVAFDSGGISDVIQDGVTGFLVREGDEAGLANRIADALGGKLDVETALRVTTAKFSRRKIQETVLKALAETLAGNHAEGALHQPAQKPA
jgi:glycosyltransferase involved in cell wall biosynthesis